MIWAFMQTAETAVGDPGLIQYGAVGILAGACLAGLIYTVREYKAANAKAAATTDRFIAYLEERSIKDEERARRDAALQAEVASTLVAATNVLARVEKALEGRS